MTEPWFDPNKFGAYYGGIGGSLVGLFGGTLGALSGYLGPRGRGRGLILGGFTFFVIIGAIHLAAGLFALISGQPYGIWYPLVLLGGIMTAVFGMLLPVVRQRYREAEMRDMQTGGTGRS